MHPTPAPGDGGRHQRRADHGGHQRPRHAPAPAPGRSRAPGHHQASPRRARSGGVPVVHGPCHQVTTSAGQITGATLSPGQRLACLSGGGVPDRGHQATRSQGQRLACHRSRADRGQSGNQASTWHAPAPQPGRSRPPGNRLACQSGGGVPVVPVHPDPAPGERPQHKRRADHGGHPVTRRAPGVPPAPAPGPGRLWAPGQRLACPCIQPQHQASAPAPGVPPAVEVCQWCMGLATRSPGERRADRGQPGHQVTRPAPGERTQHQRLACPW